MKNQLTVQNSAQSGHACFAICNRSHVFAPFGPWDSAVMARFRHYRHGREPCSAPPAIIGPEIHPPAHLARRRRASRCPATWQQALHLMINKPFVTAFGFEGIEGFEGRCVTRLSLRLQRIHLKFEPKYGGPFYAKAAKPDLGPPKVLCQ